MTQLNFATRAHVVAGSVHEERWEHDFTLDLGGGKYHSLDERTRLALAEGIAFHGVGPVVVRSSSVRVEPKTVFWMVSKRYRSANGGSLVSTVTWETPNDAPNASKGEIRILFPHLPGVAYSPMIHSGPRQLTDNGWVVREATCYQSGGPLYAGLFTFVLLHAVAISLFAHGLLWALYLKRVKHARLAAFPPHPPRIHHPNPIAEWSHANVCVCAGGALTTFWTVLTIKDGYQSSGFWWFEGGWVVCAIIAALTVAAWVRATMVTVLVEDDSISFARGRRASRWIKARWSELRDVRVMSRTHQGTTTEWIQVVLPDGKKLKIPESITDYSTLRETMLKHAHGAAPQQ